jgi:staphylococcal nuclease domain-containing protein 1
MSQDFFRGHVVGILSGDSLIVRFLKQNIVQNVCLEHVIAPKYGKTDGTVRDEPHAFDSWDFLRNLCIDQPVIVTPPTNKPDLTRSHPAFGKMPVFFSRVRLQRRDEDVGLTCVTNGWVRIRAPPNRSRDTYVSSLYAGEAAARRQNLGVWRPNGFVRQLPVSFSAQRLLDEGEFDAIVESVYNGSTLALFLLPRHERIVFQIAACQSPSARRTGNVSDQFGQQAREFSIRFLLHRSTRVRLCSAHENGLFLGPIIDRSDRFVRSLITEGLARFNQNTADLAPSSIEYERCECEARAQRKNIWADEPPFTCSIQKFQGEVRRILGTSALDLWVRGERRIVQFNCIRVPPFVPGGGSEPFSFEARERLRKLLIGKFVDVVVDGAVPDRFFATVYFGTVCINELLLREGYAKVINPFCGRESERLPMFRRAQGNAESGRLRVHGSTSPAPLIVRDLSLNTVKEVAVEHLNEFLDIPFRGIVEDILGGNRFAVLVPERLVMLRVAVNGVRPLSPNDRLGQEAMAFCAQHYLNREIEFCVREVDRSGGYISNMCLLNGDERVDLATAFLSQGLAEIHDRTASTLPNYQRLVEMRDKAARDGYGKWADKSRFGVVLERGKFYPVRIIRAWTVVDLVVQFLSESMHEVDEIIQTATPPVVNLAKSDFVAVVHRGARYRGRIEKVEDGQKVRVKLIDFDTAVIVDTSQLFDLPQRLESIPPQAISVHLAFLTLRKDEPADRDWIWTQYKDFAMHLSCVTTDDVPSVLLYDQPAIARQTLNAVVLTRQQVRFSDIEMEVGDEFIPLLEKLRQIASDCQMDDFDDE